MDTFTAISDPSRRLILSSLLAGEASVKSLVDGCAMSQPVMSKHLRILRDAGFVAVRPDGQRRLYSLALEPLEELDAWLAPYRRFWAGRLDALERHLESQQNNSRGEGGDR